MVKEREIIVELENGNSYPIYIGSDNLGTLGSKLKQLGLKHRVMVITNPQLNRLYGKTVSDSLTAAGFQVRVLPITAGEEQKNIRTIEKLYNVLIDAGFDRRDTLVALGGGVVGDLTGFVAATYMRGINYVQAPTTLLAQVDSSVGGKTGFNQHGAKNMIGAFYQPRLVLADVATLKSLPERELHTGMAEVIKYGLIKSKTFFESLEKVLIKGIYLRGNGLQLTDEELITIVKKCCEIKAAVVSADEKEKDIRVILNFGHTFGHALEALTEYKVYTHGEAVALGMLAAVELSVKLGYVEKSLFLRLADLYRLVRLPQKLENNLPIGSLIKKMYQDKKTQSGILRLVVLKELGKAVVEEIIDEQLIKKAWGVL